MWKRALPAFCLWLKDLIPAIACAKERGLVTSADVEAGTARFLSLAERSDSRDRVR